MSLVPSRRQLLIAASSALAVAGSVAAWTATDAPGPASPRAMLSGKDATAAASGPRLAIASKFADPGVLKVGTTYYAYATNIPGRTVPVATATSARGPWKVRPTGVLPKLGAWAKPGQTWAPEVTRRPDGTFVLYYTASSRTRKTGCVGAAVARSPLGPFRPVGSGPLVCDVPRSATQGKLRGEIIDAGSFVEGRNRYLVYKVGYNGYYKPSFLLLQRLSADGLHRVGAPKVILKQTSEPYTTEAPFLVKHGSKYVLFYSAGFYGSDVYQTRYAVASRLGGPYTKAAKPLMTTQSLGRKVNGPGGASVLHDGNTWWIVFHGALDPKNPARPSPMPRPKPLMRGMYVAQLGWSGDHPVVR
ncbi:hypothetical protein DZF91_18770 [Actinomadura logoneensis]|uniref:Family 43 glycosylhydrolase n=1 Tax=Actinomadura logoneensis TaxID=2293572 RepID=A0A372JJC7_9ACTN|nr:glycoside hydrolase family 43 protein [Actinomadura logoneensis]RFU40125.1 hypothetical protein DZF91_18770 [Actinomadura logoneensis]